jgi:hypothetical protein
LILPRAEAIEQDTTIFDYCTVLVKKSSDNMLGQSGQFGAKVKNSISSIDTYAQFSANREEAPDPSLEEVS